MTVLEPGTEVAPGLILRERLSQGVLAETWLAERERGGGAVAVKLTTDPQGALLLERECALGQRVSHPRLVACHGFMMREDGLALAQSPFLPGGNARGLASRPPAEALAALADIADALAHLHARGIIHRDLKPANVLLDADGRPHLIDLSVAGVLGPEPSVLHVEGGLTLSVASPEQRAGQPAHPADDAWALGLLVRELVHERSARVDALVDRLMDPDPHRRPSAETARDELRRAAQDAVVRLVPPPREAPAVAVVPRVAAVSVPLAGTTVVSSSRSPVILGIGAAALIAIGLLAFLLLYTHGTDRPSAPPSTAVAVAPPTPPPSAPLPLAAPPTPPAPRVLSRSQEPPRAASAPVVPKPVSQPPPGGDAFGVAVGDAMAAADRRAWADADAALQRASALRPGAPELTDLSTRIAEGRRGDEIDRLRALASTAAASEDWKTAIAACEQALKLDPALAFAQQGLSRARERQQVVDAIERHLAQPERLATDAVAHEAELTLDRAHEMAPGPRLSARMAELERALATSRVTVEVRLSSDGLTQVTVLRSGPLGAFKEKAVTLRPGTWTVLGTRAGYRDVRRTVVVAPGHEATPVIVRCEEPL